MDISIKELQKRSAHAQNPHDLIDCQMKLAMWHTLLCETEQEKYAYHLIAEQERREKVAKYIAARSNVSRSKETAFLDCAEYYKKDAEAKRDYNKAKLDRMDLGDFLSHLSQKVGFAKQEWFKNRQNEV